MNFQQDETLNINTPENVAFGYSVAGIGSRFLAALIDTALIFFLQIIIFLPLLYFVGMDGLRGENINAWIVALFSFLAFIFFWGYYIFFELAWNGQSPGKRIVGLRVVRSDGTPITLYETLIRNLMRLIDILPTAYGVGVIAMFIDSKSRRLGDMAGSTLVVHVRKALALDSISVSQNKHLVPGAGSSLFPVERLTNADLQLLEDYILRRDQLPNRYSLALQIVRKLYVQVGILEYEQPARPDDLLDAIAYAAANRYSSE